MRRIFGLALLCLAAVTEAAVAQRYYDVATLQAEQERRREHILHAVYTELLPNVPAGDQAALSNLEVEMPLRSDFTGALPLDFYAHAGEKRIYVPIESLKFASEISGTAAWLMTNDCFGLFSNYLQNIGVYGTPFTAFGITEDIASDTRVDLLWHNIADGALYFILAHEIGHVALRHQGNTSVRSIAEEIAADDFALDLLARLRLNPTGVFIFFLTASHFDPTVPGSHPLSPDRIRVVADHIASRPNAFVAANSGDPEGDRLRALAIAGDLGRMAEVLPALRGFSEEARRQAFPLINLKNACAAGR